MFGRLSSLTSLTCFCPTMYDSSKLVFLLSSSYYKSIILRRKTNAKKFREKANKIGQKKKSQSLENKLNRPMFQFLSSSRLKKKSKIEKNECTGKKKSTYTEKKLKKLYDLINKRCIEWMVVQNTEYSLRPARRT